MRSLPLAALVVALPAAAGAADVTPLRWNDLIPGAAHGAERSPTGVVQHGSYVDIVGGEDVVTAYDGKTVTLSGYAIPLDMSAEGATSFMLVPFVGACIHVPPPPPNQLVFVTSAEPIEIEWLFDPYTVTGTFTAAPTSTDIADVGYTMTVDRVEPWRQ